MTDDLVRAAFARRQGMLGRRGATTVRSLNAFANVLLAEPVETVCILSLEAGGEPILWLSRNEQSDQPRDTHSAGPEIKE